MTAGAPPGWYPDPVAGRTRGWDGARWHDPAPADPPAPRRRLRRALVIGATLSVVVIVLVGGCTFLAVRSQQDFEETQRAFIAADAKLRH